MALFTSEFCNTHQDYAIRASFRGLLYGLFVLVLFKLSIVIPKPRMLTSSA